MASDKTRLLALYDVDKQAKALLEQGRPGDALAAVDDCLAALAADGIALPADKSIVSSVRRARAKALIALGRKDEARATLGEVVRDPLLRTAGSLELGILLEALTLRSALAESDDLDAALVDLERIVRLERSNRERLEPLCRMALLWARRGVAPLALRTIALVTGPADFSHTGHYHEGLVALELGDPERARAIFETIVQKKRKAAPLAAAALERLAEPRPARAPRADASAELGAADALRAAGRDDEAHTAYRACLRKDPLEAAAALGLGALRLEAAGEAQRAPGAGDDALDEAEHFLELAAVLAPERALAHELRGRVHERRGAHAAAREAFERALALDPGSASVRSGLARALAALGLGDAAEKTLAVSDDPAARVALADKRRAAGELDAALEALAPALAGASPPVPVLLCAAEIELARRAPAAAAAHLGRLLAAEPRHAVAERLLGRAELAAGRAAEALGAFERALGLEPGHALALAGASEALAALGRTDEALARTRERLAALPPGDPDLAPALAALGALLRGADRAAEADASFLDAVAGAPADPALVAAFRAHLDASGRADGAASWARTEAGLILLGKGEHDAAIAHFEEAAKAEPTELRHRVDAARAAAQKRFGPKAPIDRAENALIEAKASDPFLLVRFAAAVLEGKLLGRAARLVEAAIAESPGDDRLPQAYAAFLAARGLAREQKAFLEWVTALRRGQVRVRPLRATGARSSASGDGVRPDAADEQKSPAAHDLLRRVRKELEPAGRLHELVDELDRLERDAVPVAGPAGNLASLRVAHAEALLRVDRQADARAVVAKILGGDSDKEHGAAFGLLARLERAAGRLDEAIWASEAAHRLSGTAQAKGEALALAATCYEQKGARALADRRLEAAVALAGSSVCPFAAEIHLLRDERLEARSAFERGVKARDRELVESCRLGLAEVAVLTGELERARREVDLVEDTPDAVAVRRRRAAILHELGDLGAEKALLVQNLTVATRGEHVAASRLRLAEITLAEGARDGALARLDELRATLRTVDAERAVFLRADRLAEKLRAARERASPGKRTRLAAPALVQKRDHCGPCVAELCLRFYGRELSSAAIAAAVKGPRGTPPWALGELFRAQGFVVRRCEATLAAIRALVDRGIPVVLEEAYSTTSHVTLAIGYDDELELLIVQDPMQLGPRETPYEELDRLRGVFGHGALVVVPADDAERRAALDELGVVDSPSVLATEDGLRRLRAREWDAASACFERALELAPDRELAAIGRLEAALGRVAADGSPADGLAAVTALVEAARTRFAGAEWPRQFSGRLALRAGRLAEARDDFRAAHERDPGDADNVWHLGQCAAAQGEHERAVELFHAALLRDPGHVEAHESLAAAYLDQKRRDRARHFVELALALDPDDARNHENQGLYHELDGRSGEALACFDRALARDPGNARAAVARGRCLVSLGRRGDADAAFARALELAPGNDRLRVQIGAVLLDLDDVKGAWAVVSPALECETKVAPVCALAGACLFRLERPDEAEPLLRRALAEIPDYGFAAHELGRGLLAAGRFDRALALFEERRLREPDAPRHALDAADALLALGRKEEACRTASGVLERLGAFPELVRRVAKLLHDAGRFADARHAFEEPIERALDKGKIDRPLVRTYGAFLAAVGDERAAYVWTRIETGYGLLGRPEALALFEELRASEPGDLRHEESCILAVEAMGQPEQALERSLRLLEATGWKSPRLLRRHYQLGWRNSLHKGGTGKVWEQALERNPDDLAIIEGLVQHQADMGFGDSHYAVWWKKKLEDLRRGKAGVEGGGAA